MAKTKQVRQEIIDRYQNGEEIPELAREYSTNYNYIYKLLRASDIKPRGIVKLSEFDKPITLQHYNLGRYMLNRRYYFLRLNTAEMAKLTNFSSQKINKIERGVFDFSFCDLLKIIKYYQIELPELMQLLK